MNILPDEMLNSKSKESNDPDSKCIITDLDPQISDTDPDILKKFDSFC